MLDLHEGVRDIFQEAQDRYPYAGAAELFVRIDGREPTGYILFRTGLRPGRPRKRTSDRCLYNAQDILADRKRRLLAGERPKLRNRGRPPTIWIRAAAELGIDLGRTTPLTKKEHVARRHDKRVRAKLLAGERPSFRSKPPTRWLRIAKELGIDLGRTT